MSAMAKAGWIIRCTGSTRRIRAGGCRLTRISRRSLRSLNDYVVEGGSPQNYLGPTDF